MPQALLTRFHFRQLKAWDCAFPISEDRLCQYANLQLPTRLSPTKLSRHELPFSIDRPTISVQGDRESMFGQHGLQLWYIEQHVSCLVHTMEALDLKMYECSWTQHAYSLMKQCTPGIALTWPSQLYILHLNYCIPTDKVLPKILPVSIRNFEKARSQERLCALPTRFAQSHWSLTFYIS